MAEGPIDYSAAFAPQTPIQSLAQGFQIGTAIRDDVQQQNALQQQAEAAKRQQAAIQGLLMNRNASADDYSAATLLFPGMKDQVKQAWDIKNTAQQESLARDTGQVFAALQANKPEIAIQQLQRRADIGEKSGMSPQEVQQLRTQAQIIEADPNYARSSIGMFLSGTEAGRKVLTAAQGVSKEEREQALAPAKLAQEQAAAGIKTAEAGVAPTRQALEVENLAEDAESKRFKRQIDALDTQIRQADSETRRGELTQKRDELALKRDEAVRAKGEATQSKLDKIDLSLNTVKAITEHPAIASFWTLGTPGTLAGKVSGLIPGTDRRDLQGLVDTLQSQQFLTGVQNLVGLGALSDAEGKKIGSAVASLDLDQRAGAFKNALGVIKSELEKAQRTALASPSVPTKGGAFVTTVPGVGSITEGDINVIMQRNPGSTRAQALQYLNSVGKAR